MLSLRSGINSQFSIVIMFCILSLTRLSFGQDYNCIINESDFEGLKIAVLDIKFENDRAKNGIDIVKRTNCCFTSAQIYQLAESFSFASNLTTFLKGVYDNILDDQSADFYKLLSLFKFESDKNSFNSFIASHRSVCSGYEKEHHKYSERKEQNENIKHPGHNNIPGQTVNDGGLFVEWMEPERNVTTVHRFIRLKAKVFCNSVPDIALIVDKLTIHTQPEKIEPYEDKGYIYTYYTELHEGDNHIMLRLRNQSAQTYVYSKDLVINCQPE